MTKIKEFSKNKNNTSKGTKQSEGVHKQLEKRIHRFLGILQVCCYVSVPWCLHRATMSAGKAPEDLAAAGHGGAKARALEATPKIKRDFLPTNVIRMRGTKVARYGVKMRFCGHSLRIGSQYFDSKSAGTVAEIFRDCAIIDKEGFIAFDMAKLKEYEGVNVKVFLPFTVVHNVVPVTKWMQDWRAKWEKKKRHLASTDNSKRHAKRRKSSGSLSSNKGAGAPADDEGLTPEEILSTDSDDSSKGVQPAGAGKSNLTRAETKVVEALVKALAETGLASKRPFSSQDRVFEDGSLSIVEDTNGLKLIVSLPGFEASGGNTFGSTTSWGHTSGSTTTASDRTPSVSESEQDSSYLAAIDQIDPGTLYVTAAPTVVTVRLAEGMPTGNLLAAISRGSAPVNKFPFVPMTAKCGVFALATANLEPAEYTFRLVDEAGTVLSNEATLLLSGERLDSDLPDNCDDIFDNGGKDPDEDDDGHGRDTFGRRFFESQNAGAWGTGNGDALGEGSDFDITEYFDDIDALKCDGNNPEKVVINFRQPVQKSWWQSQTPFSLGMSTALVSVIIGIFTAVIQYGQFAGVPATVLKTLAPGIGRATRAVCNLFGTSEQCSGVVGKSPFLQGSGGEHKGLFQSFTREPLPFYPSLQKSGWALWPSVLLWFFYSTARQSPQYRDQQFMKLMQVVCAVEGFTLYASGIHLGFLLPSFLLGVYAMTKVWKGLEEEKFRRSYIGRTSQWFFVLAAVLEAAASEYFGPGSFSAKHGAHVLQVNPPVSRKMISVNMILIFLTTKQRNKKEQLEHLVTVPLFMALLSVSLGLIGGLTPVQTLGIWWSTTFQIEFLFLCLCLPIRKSGVLDTFFGYLIKKGWWRSAERSYW